MTTNLTAAMTFQFIINEDNGHYFTQNAALMNEPSLRSYIDQYADGGVNVISFCTNGMRASFRSRVLEAIWDALPPEADPTAVCQQWLKSYLHGLPEEGPDENDCHDNWPFHAKLFQTAGLNPYRIWLDQCRRRGVKAWISLRMNDCHHVAPCLAYRADRRWFQHPQWRRDRGATKIQDGQSWEEYYVPHQPDICWDYAVPEVRALMAEFFAENVELFDADAFELDFMRDPYCLTPGRERHEAHCLTELLHNCRATLDKWGERRGRRLDLVVRVPWDPAVAQAWGFDVQTWCAEALVDTIVASAYWRSCQDEFPAEAWNAVTGGRATVFPGADMWTAAAPELPFDTTTAENLRGWMNSMYAQKMPGVYLFNFPFCLRPEFVPAAEAERFRTMLRQKLSPENLAAGPCRYQIGYVDFCAPGEQCQSILPAPLTDGQTIALKMHVGQLPRHGKARLAAQFAEPNGGANCQFVLNGQSVEIESDLPLDGLRTGENRIAVNCLSGRPATLTNLCLTIREEMTAKSNSQYA